MRLFRYPEFSHPIKLFGSQGAAISKVVHIHTEASVHWLFLEPGGLIGYHPAVENQLFLIVQGEGWARAGDEPAQPVSAGQAAFWEEGEYHEVGTERGMAAIILEGSELKPLLSTK